MAALVRGVAAVPAGLLPRRRWQSFDSLPIERLLIVSALATLAGGLAIGARGFLAYAQRVADGLATATFDIATRQAARPPGGTEITTLAPMTFSAFSLAAFLIATPTGWLATYLVVSGVVRAVGALLDDPIGDPLLTGLDSLMTGSRRRARETSSRRARERLEGPETPDLLFTGEWAGAPEADYVVVAARRKPDWTPGTFVITGDKWYTIGHPFDLDLPQGLRTAYPLTEQKVCEVLRRGVAYELPTLRKGMNRIQNPEFRIQKPEARSRKPPAGNYQTPGRSR